MTNTLPRSFRTQVPEIENRDHSPCITGAVGWGYISDKDRGVFALRDIKAGETIECSPVVVSPYSDYLAAHGREIFLDNYLLEWEEKGEDVESAVGLGYLMLYNHNHQPCAKFAYDYPNRTISLVALRDIRAGEEITIDYKEPWFESELAKKPDKPSPCLTGWICWDYIPKGGRGIIAMRDIPAGTEIECSPVIVAEPGDYTPANGEIPVIDDYLLRWDDKGENAEYAIGLGYLMVYNHSGNANADFRYNFPAREITVFATRDIKAGEEVAIDYDVPLWFTPKD